MHNQRLESAFEYIKGWQPNKQVRLNNPERVEDWKPKEILIQVKKKNKPKVKNNDLIKQKIIKLLENNEYLTVTQLKRQTVYNKNLIINLLTILLIEKKIFKIDRFKFSIKKEANITDNKIILPIKLKPETPKILSKYVNLNFEEYILKSTEDRNNRIHELNKKIF